jgi:inner membrane transporter RhtA
VARSDGRLAGLLFAVASSISNQAGAGIGSLAFPAIGPLGVVAVRQFVTAIIFVIICRPNWRRLSRQDWLYTTLLGISLGAMSFGVYSAIDRIGLGLAVTIEFLGPLAVTIATMRRKIDLLAILVAGVGVVLLVKPGATTDYIGIAFGLLGAAGWACYIVLNRVVGARMRGLQGPAVASAVSAVICIPIAVVLFSAQPPPLWAIVVAVGCAIFSSLIPFTADLAALRRVSPGLFGTLASLNPVWAALIGVLVLGQLLELMEWTGLFLIVGSNALVASLSLMKRA